MLAPPTARAGRRRRADKYHRRCDCHGQREHGLRGERLARRRDVRALSRRSELGQRDVAGVLRGLQAGHILGAAPCAAAAPAPIDEPPAAVAAPTARRPRHPHRPRCAGSRRPGKLILGAGLAIATNMAKSLDVPTATSFRNVPAKLLEVNRKVINGYRSRTGQGKVSFTHLIGYAVVRAIADAVPGDEQRVRRRRRRQAAPRPATSTSTSASPSTSTRATASARSSSRSSATPTRSTSPASSPPTRT